MFDPKEVQFYIYDYTLTTPGISGWRRGSQYPANTADITQASYMKTASFFSSWQIISLLKYSYIRGRYRRQFVVPS